MNPLFPGEEVRFYNSNRFRKKAGDAKLPFYHSFVQVLMSLAAESCRSRAESVHLLKPIYNGERVARVPTLCPDDSADAQDDVTELFDLFDAHLWGWKDV